MFFYNTGVNCRRSGVRRRSPTENRSARRGRSSRTAFSSIGFLGGPPPPPPPPTSFFCGSCAPASGRLGARRSGRPGRTDPADDVHTAAGVYVFSGDQQLSPTANANRDNLIIIARPVRRRVPTWPPPPPPPRPNRTFFQTPNDNNNNNNNSIVVIRVIASIVPFFQICFFFSSVFVSFGAVAGHDGAAVVADVPFRAGAASTTRIADMKVSPDRPTDRPGGRRGRRNPPEIADSYRSTFASKSGVVRVILRARYRSRSDGASRARLGRNSPSAALPVQRGSPWPFSGRSFRPPVVVRSSAFFFSSDVSKISFPKKPLKVQTKNLLVVPIDLENWSSRSLRRRFCGSRFSRLPRRLVRFFCCILFVAQSFESA